MKKIISGLFVITTFFIACKKEQVKTDPPVDNHEKYAVQFNISAFSQETTDINSRKAQTPVQLRTPADSLRDHINFILYKVFDAQTRQTVKTIFQSGTGNSAFGQLHDTLPTGRYIITITASPDSIFNGYSLPDIEGFINWLPGSDVFYRRMELTISGAVTQPVVLERIVSKVTVTLKDQIPYTAKYFKYVPQDSTSTGLPPYFSYFSGTIIRGDDRTTFQALPAVIPIADSALGTTYYKFDFYVLNTDTRKMQLDLKCLDAQMIPIAEKVIPNVLLVKNKKTILSGTLFSPVGNGTTVNVDGAWKTDSIFVSF